MNNTDNTIECPYCAEPINPKAKKCKHCGEMLDQHLRELDLLKKERSSANINTNVVSPSYASPYKKNFGHFKHLVFSVCTAGFWVPFWFYFYISRDKNFYN